MSKLLTSLGERMLAFGASGKSVLKFAGALPMAERLPYLRDAFAHFKLMIERGWRWRTPPVDIRTFLESEDFLNQKGIIYPEVMKALVECNSGLYVEALLTGGIGSAKALDLDTPIPTPKGWTRMGDLRPGDQVFDETGSPCDVLATSPVFEGRACYEVQFSDGNSIVACGEHQWKTQTRSDRRQNRPATVRTTRELYETQHYADKWHLFSNHSIPVAGAIDCKPQRLRIDPYVLGVWLGDGSARSGDITSADPFIVEQVNQHFPTVFKGRYRYACYCLAVNLRMHGLAGKKKIPVEYLRASYDQRLALLQGLMDTDGSNDPKKGVCTITQVREALAWQVYELVASLGLKPTMKTRRAVCGGPDGGPCYTVSFTAYDDVPVFRLPRKLNGLRKPGAQSFRQKSRYVQNVVPVPSRPTRCIMVASPSHLFLAGRGFIPTHNSSIAVYSQGYQVYVLSCLDSPQREFGLAPSSEIVIVFQSLNARIAKEGDYARLKALIDGSPYFQTLFPYNKQIESEMQFPKRLYVRPLSGDPQAAIGQNLIGGVLEEVNFMAKVEHSNRSSTGGAFDQANDMYNSIVRRRKSRFLHRGAMPGLLCVVSSKRYPGEFTDIKAKEAELERRRHGRSTIFVYDKRVWEIKPEGTYGGERFRVFAGDASRKPRILEPDEIVTKDMEGLVAEVPVEYRSEFDRDLLSAIRDIAGMSTLALHPYIVDTEAVSAAFGKAITVLSREDCDFVQTTVQVYPKRILMPDEPRFAHVDLSLTGDSTGVAVGYVKGFLDMPRGTWSETLPLIAYDLILEVKPPRGGEIEFACIRALLYKLRELGMNLKWITFDSFESRDSQQILAGQGFQTGNQSMDTDSLAYDMLKTAFYDRRVSAPEHPKALRELVRLERDQKTGKVDHPKDSSKDLSDAMAGVCYGLTRRREIWIRHNVPVSKIPSFLFKKAENP